MMHIVGFEHEHSRWDRDQYITVIWENVKYGFDEEFEKMNLTYTSYYGEPYDYYSIMHYSKDTYAKPGKNALVPKDPRYLDIIGSTTHFSDGDVRRMNRMYGCPQNVVVSPNCFDLASACGSQIGKCGDPNWRNLMTQYCKKTCRLC